MAKIKQKKNPSSDDDDPLTILKKRFAKGEITKEEYEEMIKEKLKSKLEEMLGLHQESSHESIE